jgi:uncharacterized membrane protein YdbT with pleckstrin-like domain
MAPISILPDRQAMNSFCLLPNSKFGGADIDEHTILLLRAHPFTQISWVFNAVALVLFVLFLDIFWGQSLNIRTYFWLNILIVVGVAAYAWYNFLLWYFTVGFVTNKRIIDINYYGIIRRQIIQAPITKIADVTSKTSGYFRQIFNYGDIDVQTEGFIQNIIFDNVPNPDQAIVIIENAAEGGTP